MGGRLAPAVAAVRVAVREHLAAHVAPGSTVLAACSGGADSLALAAALAFEGPRRDVRVAAAVVDHRLQAGSDAVAARAAEALAALGIADVAVGAVEVSGPGGPEGAARDARYAALRARAAELGAAAVALGHTLDDQAETVLLGLARGSGARSLSGMAAVRDLWHRPLLPVTRATTREACAAQGLQPWDDPHNADRRYARVRVRLDALPALEAALGPGVAAALARTAAQLRDDADALDAWAAQVPDAYDVAALAALPRAVRTRVLHRLALAEGAAPGAMGARHVAALEALVSAWHGQGPVGLPGGVEASRACGRLTFARS
ncbi:tRNA(Ile)-lysidine synthase [Motilibacter peucedani]|uniref:tRNA(Ile)-lysidine synthase n=1 Tax=Motilibacter peucedani TaxID=598650 RepID=A0A420XPT7_9ACTN|nr:tRNA lysidine(34) synthetase TilS [Motilibacter peucedani]RKS75283.1 tRNA(Ile)-lysidine synthase [Motilibacter peucedani]